ncbi:TIGR03084 family metal-binding protein [Streptomyces canus]|uniref:TIGR03084 family metal-binding protein n=1 Tax=Streptomyces canus TaxID=58343 RepID=UPI002DD983AF|nr:TIGR03084 family metal-binding protein [Streptomyces canus]WSD84232.1 TIGR03084 family metal-binding protein [Streptomyces canus]
MSESSPHTHATGVVTGLVADLTAEHEALVEILRDLPEESWESSTPAPRWTVRDQVAHLAHFDTVARISLETPEAFETMRDGIDDLQRYIDGVGGRTVGMSGARMLDRWAEENARMRESAVRADHRGRHPWFGPPMSLASMLTARLMETWAHGQDIVDTFGLLRPATPRLRQVARIGLLALPHSFRTHGLDVPAADVAVVLDPPGGGEPWTWGDPLSPNRVSGPAEDFCLVVTRRRHVDDTELQLNGPVATEWMTIAQAFAGPPGGGRASGQFERRLAPMPKPHEVAHD